MKDVWVLYERSDLARGGEWDYQNYATACRAFADFDTAKQAMRDTIKRYATEKSSMFDGEGNLNELLDQYYYDDDERDTFTYVGELLRKLCLNELDDATAKAIKPLFCTTFLFAAEITTDNGEPVLLMRGDDDGPCNGVNPYVHTNLFSMNDDTKDYYFYVEDMFRMDSDFSSHLFLDLKKVSVE